MKLQQAGIFNHTGTFTHNDGTFKYKLVMNDPQNITLTGGNSKIFSNRLIIFKYSNDAKYLEVYFDDPIDTSTDGAAITWEPAVVSPSLYTSGKRLECYTDTTNKVMTCSWTGPLTLGASIELGQTIATLTSGNKMTLNLSAKTTPTSSTSLGTALADASCDESGSRYFYTL